jgi:pimeloyl-ACP methyl ester carboxylesterase
MYPPGQIIAVRDGGIGLPQDGAALPLVVGHCSGGVANTLYFSTNPNSLKDTLGQGQAVEQALPVMEEAGGVLLLKTAASTAGSAGSVTKTAASTSTSTGTVTVAGAPYDAYQVKVRIKSTGGLGVARFDYTLEALGVTPAFSEELTVPAGGTYAIPGTNLTLTFVPGGGPILFENGDSHTFACTAPQYTTSDLATAVTALLAALGSYNIEEVVFTGRSASASAAATMAAAIATHMASLEARHRWARAMMDGGADTGANVKSSFAAFANSRVAVVFGQADVPTINTRPGWGTPRFSASFVLFERAVGADLSENLGRVASGSLRCSFITADENTNQQFLEADRINTLRTHDGIAGYYSTNGYLKSASGSDFIYWDWGRVIDRVCRAVFVTLQPWLLRKVRILTDGTGKLDVRDAERIKKALETAIRAVVKGPTVEGVPDMDHVTDFRVSVDTTNDVKTTRLIKPAVQLVPTFPIEGAATDIGFVGSLAA